MNLVATAAVVVNLAAGVAMPVLNEWMKIL